MTSRPQDIELSKNHMSSASPPGPGTPNPLADFLAFVPDQSSTHLPLSSAPHWLQTPVL